MSEQKTGKQLADDNPTNHSTISLPDIFKQLDQSDQASLKAVWNDKDIPLAGKLKFIDVFVNTQPVEFRSAYRKWRFEVDKGSILYFAKSQTSRMQSIFGMLLAKNPKLDESYSEIPELRKPLKKHGEFQEWANSGHLENREYPWLKKSIILLVLLCALLLAGVVILAFQSQQHRYDNSLKIDQNTQSNSSDKTLFYLDYRNNSVIEGRICLFDSHTNSVEQIAKCTNHLFLWEVATTKDKIFGISHIDRSFEIYDLNTRQISRGPDPPEWRRDATVAYFKDKLYYLGGEDPKAYEWINQVDVLIDGTWQIGPAFPFSIYFVQTVACDGILYVIDGCGNRKIYRLSDDEQEWIEIGEIPEKQFVFGVASLNGKIYITGGRNSYAHALKSCLCFDPSVPVDSRISRIADMNYEREEHSLIVANGKLYAIGGFEDPGNFCNSIEEYDPQTNEWREVGNIKIK